MNDTLLVAIIGAVATVTVGLGSGLLVYRRAMRVDLRKVDLDKDLGLIDRWKDYSAELRQQVAALTAETRAQDDKLEEQQRHIMALERRLFDMERRLAGVEEREGT